MTSATVASKYNFSYIISRTRDTNKMSAAHTNDGTAHYHTDWKFMNILLPPYSGGLIISNQFDFVVNLNWERTRRN